MVVVGAVVEDVDSLVVIDVVSDVVSGGLISSHRLGPHSNE